MKKSISTIYATSFLASFLLLPLIVEAMPVDIFPKTVNISRATLERSIDLQEDTHFQSDKLLAQASKFVLYDKKSNHAVESFTVLPNWKGFGEVEYRADPSGANMITWTSGFYSNYGAKAYITSPFILVFNLPINKIPFMRDVNIMGNMMKDNLRRWAHVKEIKQDSINISDNKDPEVLQLLKVYATSMRMYGQNTRNVAKEARGEFSFTKDGKAMKAQMRVPFIMSETPMIVNSMYATYVTLLNTNAYIYPSNKATQALKEGKSILKTRKIDKEWEQMVANTRTNVSQSAGQEIQKRSNIIRQTGDDISNMRRDSYEKKNASDERISKQRSEATRGVRTEIDPFTGRSIETKNSASHVWINSQGKQLNTENGNYNPNSDPKLNKNEWRQIR